MPTVVPHRLQVFASGRDEEELRDTLVHIAKLAAADPNFQQKYGVTDDVDGDTAAAAAASVSQVGRRTAPAGSTRAVVDLLEHVFAAPCEDSYDEFSSDEVSALVALARW